VGEGITNRASQTWAMLIKRVYEIDPLACPKCGSQMTVVAFIEPPQRRSRDLGVRPALCTLRTRVRTRTNGVRPALSTLKVVNAGLTPGGWTPGGWGLPHQITQRGNRRQQTFFNDGDHAAYP